MGQGPGPGTRRDIPQGIFLEYISQGRSPRVYPLGDIPRGISPWRYSTGYIPRGISPGGISLGGYPPRGIPPGISPGPQTCPFRIRRFELDEKEGR